MLKKDKESMEKYYNVFLTWPRTKPHPTEFVFNIKNQYVKNRAAYGELDDWYKWFYRNRMMNSTNAIIRNKTWQWDWSKWTWKVKDRVTDPGVLKLFGGYTNWWGWHQDAIFLHGKHGAGGKPLIKSYASLKVYKNYYYTPLGKRRFYPILYTHVCKILQNSIRIKTVYATKKANYLAGIEWLGVYWYRPYLKFLMHGKEVFLLQKKFLKAFWVSQDIWWDNAYSVGKVDHLYEKLYKRHNTHKVGFWNYKTFTRFFKSSYNPMEDYNIAEANDVKKKFRGNKLYYFKLKANTPKMLNSEYSKYYRGKIIHIYRRLWLSEQRHHYADLAYHKYKQLPRRRKIYKILDFIKNNMFIVEYGRADMLVKKIIYNYNPVYLCEKLFDDRKLLLSCLWLKLF